MSTWFRDYVFMPLAGRRPSTARGVATTVATFLVSGLWHGAAWKFVAWGGVNGTSIAAEKLTGWDTSTPGNVPGGEHLVPRPRVLARMLFTFGLACLFGVFFRARDLSEAITILGRMASDLFAPHAYDALLAEVLATSSLWISLVVVAGFVAWEWVQRRHPHGLCLAHWPLAARWAVYTTMLWGGLSLMPTEQVDPFIYFNF
jgi:D-alanyl-lipoteichoic acid acyltransferase DltB (MBOAT superfamily)